MTHNCLRTHLSYFFCLLSLILISGCGGSSSGPIVPPPPPPPPVKAVDFVYVANGGDNTISGFKLDSAGQLSVLPGSPYKLSFSPVSVLSDPQGRFLLIRGEHMLVPAGITATHELTFPSTAQLPEGTPVVDPLGRFIFVTDNSVPSLIHVYSIDRDLSFPEVPGSPSQPAIKAAAIDPAGKFLFGFEYLDDPLYGFYFAIIHTLEIGDTGSLTRIASSEYIHPLQVYVHPSGQFFYVQYLSLGGVFDLNIYRIEPTGALTPMGGYLDEYVAFIAFPPSGNFAFSAECAAPITDYVCVLTGPLHTLTFDLTAGGIIWTPYSIPIQRPTSAAVDSTGTRLFAASSGSDSDNTAPGLLTLFRINANGQLFRTGVTASTGPLPTAVVVTQ